MSVERRTKFKAGYAHAAMVYRNEDDTPFVMGGKHLGFTGDCGSFAIRLVFVAPQNADGHTAISFNFNLIDDAGFGVCRRPRDDQPTNNYVLAIKLMVDECKMTYDQVPDDIFDLIPAGQSYSHDGLTLVTIKLHDGIHPDVHGAGMPFKGDSVQQAILQEDTPIKNGVGLKDILSQREFAFLAKKTVIRHIESIGMMPGRFDYPYNPEPVWDEDRYAEEMKNFPGHRYEPRVQFDRVDQMYTALVQSQVQDAFPLVKDAEEMSRTFIKFVLVQTDHAIETGSQTTFWLIPIANPFFEVRYRNSWPRLVEHGASVNIKIFLSRDVRGNQTFILPRKDLADQDHPDPVLQTAESYKFGAKLRTGIESSPRLKGATSSWMLTIQSNSILERKDGKVQKLPGPQLFRDFNAAEKAGEDT